MYEDVMVSYKAKDEINSPIVYAPYVPLIVSNLLYYFMYELDGTSHLCFKPATEYKQVYNV